MVPVDRTDPDGEPRPEIRNAHPFGPGWPKQESPMVDSAAMPISRPRDPFRIVRSEHALEGSSRRPKRERPLPNARLDLRPRPSGVRLLGVRIDIRA
jgi:hypothetical protein